MPWTAGLAWLALKRYFPSMTKLEKLKRDIEALPPQDFWALSARVDALLERLRERQIEARSPELDALAVQALEVHRAGKTTPLVRNS
jgi:hypothetical protein